MLTGSWLLSSAWKSCMKKKLLPDILTNRHGVPILPGNMITRGQLLYICNFTKYILYFFQWKTFFILRSNLKFVWGWSFSETLYLHSGQYVVAAGQDQVTKCRYLVTCFNFMASKLNIYFIEAFRRFRGVSMKLREWVSLLVWVYLFLSMFTTLGCWQLSIRER